MHHGSFVVFLLVIFLGAFVKLVGNRGCERLSRVDEQNLSLIIDTPRAQFRQQALSKEKGAVEIANACRDIVDRLPLACRAEVSYHSVISNCPIVLRFLFGLGWPAFSLAYLPSADTA